MGKKIYKGTPITINSKFTDEFYSTFGDIDEDNMRLLGEMLKAEELHNLAVDGTPPDTYGAEVLFLEDFVNLHMSIDFPYIAKDFLDHEYHNLKNHEKVKYLNTDCSENYPTLQYQNYILNLMMNAVHSGSQYTKDLFIQLYKTYYKDEYKQVKKFSRISSEELKSLISEDKNGTKTARILTMAALRNIDISDCYFMYQLLDNYRSDENTEDESYEEIEEENEEEIEDTKPCEYTSEVEKILDEYDRFISKVMKLDGYIEDYMLMVNNRDYGVENSIKDVINLLNKKELSIKELAAYVCIYNTAQAVLSVTEEYDLLLYQTLNGIEYEDYHPYSPVEERPEKKPDKLKKDESPKELSPDDKEALIKTIGDLQRQLHQKESEIKELRKEASANRKTETENRQLKQQIESNRKELAALRDYVYSTEDDTAITGTVTLDEMIKQLSEKTIIIIGGHSNWRQKMKSKFPSWEYIDASVSGALDPSIVNRADHVYFFTDTISHSTYYRYMNTVKERNVRFGYIHGVNIEKTIEYIYKDMTQSDKT